MCHVELADFLISGRHDLTVPFDSVDFSIPQLLPGGDESEYHISRNFTYFARVVRNVRRMSAVYMKIKKKKEWGIDPEMQQLNQGFESFLNELPPDLRVDFPTDGSPPWLPSPFLGNLLSYFYLTLILYHRPQLSSIDPTANPVQWKHHMMICYDSAKALCRLQEAIINVAGLEGLQSMQRGYSFTVYAGLSCILLHLVSQIRLFLPTVLGLTSSIGCCGFTRPGTQHRCQGVFGSAYADNGKGNGSLVHV